MPETDTEQPSAVEQKFSTLQGWQQVARIQMAVTVVVVAGLFANFGYRTYHDVLGGFTPERTQKAVEASLPMIAPPVGQALKQVAGEVVPEYRRLASERFGPLREKLAEVAQDRLEKLPEDAGHVLGNGLEKAFDRAMKRVEPDVASTFPSLTDPEKRAVLVTYFHDAIEARNKVLAGKVEAVAVNEAGRIAAVMEKFQIPGDADARSDEQLHKDFVRTLMMLAEQELDAGTTAPKPLPSASIDAN